MSTEQAVKYTPGALRAAKLIQQDEAGLANVRFVHSSEVPLLAELIDRETAATELLEALELMVVLARAYATGIASVDAAIFLAETAILKAKGEL